jgi:hypothetical protein
MKYPEFHFAKEALCTNTVHGLRADKSAHFEDIGMDFDQGEEKFESIWANEPL